MWPKHHEKAWLLRCTSRRFSVCDKIKSNLCGCVEIKCSFSARDKTVLEACAQTQFFCTLDENNKVILKLFL